MIATITVKRDIRRKTMGIREDYQALMAQQLSDWKVQAEHFRAGAEKIEAHAKVQYEKHLEILRATQAQASDSFQKLKGANEGTWQQFKAQMDTAGAEVKTAVEQMMSSFKQKGG
jgi:hypothetical protein